MKTRIEKLQGFSSSTYITLSFFLVAAMLPFLILSAYIHPVADDLSYALKGDNFFPNLVRDYNVWNGRYASNVFVFFNFILAQHIFIYRLYPVLLICGLLVNCYYFIATVFRDILSKTEIIFYTLLFNVLLLVGLPDESEGLYWYTGSVTYVFPFILLFPEVVLVIRFFRKEFVLNKFLHQFILFLLTIFLAGFSEVLAILLVLFFSFLAYWSWKNKSLNRIFIALSIASISGLIAVALAPGNAIRVHSYPGTQLLFHSVLYSIAQTGRFLFLWITSPMLWVATFFYLPVANGLRIPKELNLNKLLVLSILPAIIFCCVFPAYWGTGILGQHRTLNTAYIFFTLAWFLCLHLFADKFKFSGFSFLTIDKRFANVFFLLLALAALITGNGLTSWSDIVSGKVKEYDSQMTAREFTLKDCAASGNGNCSVSLLSVKPQSIFVLDLQQDSSDWMNDNYARFYNLKTVSVK